MNSYNIPKWLKLAIGLLGLGIGQRLFLTGIVFPLATESNIPIVLAVLGLFLLGIGLSLVIPIGIRFYKKYRNDRRLHRILLSYVASSLLLGIGIGLLGEAAYHFSDLSYEDIKTGMWFISSIGQLALRLLLLFSLVCIYKKQGVRKQLIVHYVMLIGLILVSGMSQLVSLGFPDMGEIALSIVDSFLLIIWLYYLHLKIK